MLYIRVLSSTARYISISEINGLILKRFVQLRFSSTSNTFP